MKTKIGLLFLFIAVVATSSIFLFKNYYFVDIQKSKNEMTNIDVVEVIRERKNDLYDLNNVLIPKEYLNKKLSGSLQHGDSFKIADTYIIHFWASWCEPCINEIPELISFSKRIDKEVQLKNTIIVLVNLDYTVEDIFKFLKSFPEVQNDVFLNIWDKKNALSKSLKIEKLPTTIIWKNRDNFQILNGVVDWHNLTI